MFPHVSHQNIKGCGAPLHSHGAPLFFFHGAHTICFGHGMIDNTFCPYGVLLRPSLVLICIDYLDPLLAFQLLRGILRCGTEKHGWKHILLYRLKLFCYWNYLPILLDWGGWRKYDILPYKIVDCQMSAHRLCSFMAIRVPSYKTMLLPARKRTGSSEFDLFYIHGLSIRKHWFLWQSPLFDWSE